MDCLNDDEINDKLTLLKNWVKFAITDYEDTKIEIRWGERKELEKYKDHMSKFLVNVNEATISRIIN